MALFDHHAAGYDRWYETPLGRVVDRLETELFMRMADPRPGERALDAGCGTGRLCGRLAQRGLAVVGVDVSAAMLETARRWTANQPGVDLVRADMQSLPFPSGGFDLVCAFTALEFVTVPETALRELWRQVRPRGRLVVAALNAYGAWARHRRRAAARGGGGLTAQARFFHPWELKAMLQKATGEERVQWASTVFIPPRSGAALIGLSPAVDRLGRLFLRPFGALLVMRVDKIRARRPVKVKQSLPQILPQRETVVE